MQDALAWFHDLPAPLAEWLTMLGAALLSLLASALIYRIGRRLLQRTTRGRFPATAIVQGAHLPARWLLPLIGLSLVWHGAPDDLHGVMGLRRLTALGVMACATWLVVRCINHHTAAYLASLPLKDADNLEARRLYTQTRVLSRTPVGLITLCGTALDLSHRASGGHQPAGLGGRGGHRRGLRGPTGAGQPDRRPADRSHPADPAGRRGDRGRRMGGDRGDHQRLRGREDLGRAAADRAAAMVDRTPLPELDPGECRPDRLGGRHQGSRQQRAPGRRPPTAPTSSWWMRSCAPRPRASTPWATARPANGKAAAWCRPVPRPPTSRPAT